jgi:hypothetical protein
MNYEKLGVFYLGRNHDLKSGETGEVPLLYDAKDLTTHAVVVGMTGSGKTGLCACLLEEAAIDGIPALVIDPKGDLGNLLLTFPNLAASDFRPWVNEDEAAAKKQSVDEFAASQAELWRNGLAKWSQDGARIRRLRDSAEFAIYTPGSESGIPVSILASFEAPPEAVLSDGDLLRDRIQTTATSLLGLMGIDADPIQSREHILISTILDRRWRQGQGFDLTALIHAIQSPGIERVGVMDLDAFFPEKDRFGLAMRLNNLLAAPAFQSWMSGEALDVQRLLYTATGKPRVAVVSIAYLSEAERMFFVSLLFNQVLGWMRSRPGTSSLRALMYMDEIFGYMPPSAKPPSKRPLLTMLKQARAYGLGVVLATQNPVDLDYKGLSNTGTWFLGRLQTERDKMRVLDGLEGAGAGAGGFDKAAMEKTLAGLGKRVFLMHNVHEREPVVFHTRWAMSYLRGPLTRQQIKVLMQDRPAAAPATAAATAPAAAPVPTATAAPAAPPATAAPRPVLSKSVPQVFLPFEGDGAPAYEPHLLGMGRVDFFDRKTKKLITSDDVSLLLPLSDVGLGVDWDDAKEVDLVPEDLERDPEPGAGFGSLPADAEKATSYRTWKKEFTDTLYRGRSLELFKSGILGVASEPGEDEASFRIRLSEQARTKRDAEVDKLRKRYARRVATLEERIRKAQLTVQKEQEQVSGSKMQTVISIGTTVLSAFLGRKAVSMGTLGKATTAARGVGRAAKEKRDVARAQQNLVAAQKQLAELESELEDEIDRLEERFDPTTETLETIAVRPRRSDVDVRLVALAWRPE